MRNKEFDFSTDLFDGVSEKVGYPPITICEKFQLLIVGRIKVIYTAKFHSIVKTKTYLQSAQPQCCIHKYFTWLSKSWEYWREKLSCGPEYSSLFSVTLCLRGSTFPSMGDYLWTTKWWLIPGACWSSLLCIGTRDESPSRSQQFQKSKKCP